MKKGHKRVNVIKAIGICGLAAMLLGPTLVQPSAHADNTYYRWQDERGNAVHSDRPPPPGIDYEVVSTSSSKFREVDASEGAVPPKIKPSPGNEFEQADSKPPEIEKKPRALSARQEQPGGYQH